MDDLRGRYRFPYRITTWRWARVQRFSRRHSSRSRYGAMSAKNDGLDAMRGAVNGLLISLVFWVALGVALFSFF